MAFTSRRALLVAGAATLVSGCSAGAPWETGVGEPGRRSSNSCRSPESLAKFSTLGGATLGYEVGRSITSYRADPRFIELLEAWAQEWATLGGLGAPTTIWSYGAHVDKCDSFHASGRAFDIAEVEHDNGSISCRYDTWAPGSAQQTRDYWRLAASLHLHFGYTLTYLYDEAHHNHIHVDNAVSGWDTSTFNSRSAVQVHMVQAACREVFDADVGITGTYDAATRSALRPIQAALGITRPLSDKDGWQEFLRATASAV